MGISDDISRKPKRSSYHPNTHNQSEDFVAPKKAEPAKVSEQEQVADSHKIEIEKSKQTDFFDQPSAKQEDFFPLKKKNDSKKQKPKPAEKEPTKKRSLPARLIRRIISLTLWLILLLVMLNNWSQISKIFTGNKTSTSTDSSVKIIPQDYTTPTTSNSTTQTPATTTPTTPTTTTTAPTAAATTPTTATYNKAAVKIEILNGNGIQKAADVAKKALTTAGFTVSKTGNAANFKYTTTYVYYKTGNLSAATDISNALSSNDPVATNDDKICTTYDIVIILGK